MSPSAVIDFWPWITVAALGAYHGLNPGMGWLFAVARGLQEQSRRALWGCFGPIAAGHAASVAAIVLVVGVAQSSMAVDVLRVVAAIGLVGFGVYKLLRPLSHPRWVGMRVGAWELTTWSFLTASAHGAGLMLLPVIMRLAPGAPDQLGHSAHGDATMMAFGTIDAIASTQLVAVGVHTAAMFVVMGLIAVVVFERIGLAILRRAWFNLDRLWAAALITAGALTLLR